MGSLISLPASRGKKRIPPGEAWTGTGLAQGWHRAGTGLDRLGRPGLGLYYGLWTMDYGLWTMDLTWEAKLGTMDYGLWTMAYGLWT